MGKDLGSVIIFGLINTFMVVPVSISFCAIIFRDEAFDEYMPSLVKLVLFSSAIHQLCFSLFSSLPFAVGQVQDAGLIFLSAMAGSVASSCSKPENIVPSALFILGLSTAILGVMLIIVSKLRLASIVQYLPMPVIGGYLAFIGFFCGEAGMSMMAGVQVTSITQWTKFLNPDALLLLTPGLICGLGMSYCLHKFPSPLTFPVCLISILAVFYLSMLFTGSSFQDMRDAGWISPLDEAGSSFDAWKMYDITKVEWHLFPKQIITLLGMFLVVAFSSSLDVAAIEMELGLPLDYNRELFTVGMSNLVSGLFGGYTGSYIFTQTTFNMRRGINNRLCGYMIVVGEIVIALLPVSVVSFIPKMFFGSLLVLIATELLSEWLITARTKMMHYEYAVCLLTFACIQMVGIELGMLIGIIAAMFCFVISYSNLQSVSAVTVKSSTVIRTFEERSVLIANRGKVLTVSLSGYLFFGSAVKLLQEIKSKLVAAEDDGESVSSPLFEGDSVMRRDGYSPVANSVHGSATAVSPPPSVPRRLVQRGPGADATGTVVGDGAVEKGSRSSTGAAAAAAATPSKSTSAFEGMTPLRQPVKQTSFMATSATLNQVSSYVNGGNTGGAPLSYQQQQQPPSSLPPHHHGGHHHGSHHEGDAASSHAPMRMLFSSHSLRQKHIPTVYDLSADQIQSHYESWANAQKPALERKSTMSTAATERRHSMGSADLEMGPVSTSTATDVAQASSSSKPRANSSATGASSAGIAASSASSPIPIVTERTSLLTAAITNSDAKKDRSQYTLGTSPALSSSLTSRGLEDVQEIRESSVFLQVWESQQQRKEQQRRRRSFSDLAGLATSPAHSENDLGGGRSSLGFNYDSQEHLEDLERANEQGPLLRGSSGSGKAAAASLATASGKVNGRSAGKLPTAASSSSDVPRRQSSGNGSSAASSNSNTQANAMVPTTSASVDGAIDQTAAASSQGTVTEYLILDFTGVMGVDATAARACFLTLVQFMRTANVTVVFAHLSKPVEDLLRAHNVLNDESVMIPNLDDALEWCEDQILVHNQFLKESDGATGPRSRSVEDYSRAWSERQQHSLMGRSPRLEASGASLMSLRQSKSSAAFSSNIDLLSLAEDFSADDKPPVSARTLRHILVDYLGLDLSNPSNRFRQLLESSVLTKFFTKEELHAGEIIFDLDFPATKVYFIESGTVEIVSLSVDGHDAKASSSSSPSLKMSSTSRLSGKGHTTEVVRVNKASHGGVFGEADFILGKTRTVRAYSVTDCTFWILDREHFAAMEVQQPQLCMLIQYALLRSLALSYTCSMYALHPTTAYAETGDDL